MVRTAFVTLSWAVVVVAAAAVTQGLRSGPRVMGSVLAPATAASTLAASGSIGGLQAAGGVDAERTTFTIRELHDGEVAAPRFTAFWDAELERIRTAPCPGPTAPGSTAVVMSVGATPPAHLGAGYIDYAPLLADARAEAAATCA